MSSGIYKLTFSSGRYYIGKSVNIDKRWDQHWKALCKGTHAKALQAEFDKFGEPQAEVMIYAHEDHIDILEGFLINAYWVSGYILNTTRPAPLNDSDFELVKECIGYQGGAIWNMSTLDHIRSWNKCDDQRRVMEQELEKQEREHQKEMRKIKSGTRIKELEDSIETLLQDCTRKSQEINRLKNRGFWDRLFNT